MKITICVLFVIFSQKLALATSAPSSCDLSVVQVVGEGSLEDRALVGPKVQITVLAEEILKANSKSGPSGPQDAGPLYAKIVLGLEKAKKNQTNHPDFLGFPSETDLNAQKLLAHFAHPEGPLVVLPLGPGNSGKTAAAQALPVRLTGEQFAADVDVDGKKKLNLLEGLSNGAPVVSPFAGHTKEITLILPRKPDEADLAGFSARFGSEIHAIGGPSNEGRVRYMFDSRLEKFPKMAFADTPDFNTMTEENYQKLLEAVGAGEVVELHLNLQTYRDHPYRRFLDDIFKTYGPRKIILVFSALPSNQKDMPGLIEHFKEGVRHEIADHIIGAYHSHWKDSIVEGTEAVQYHPIGESLAYQALMEELNRTADAIRLEVRGNVMRADLMIRRRQIKALREQRDATDTFQKQISNLSKIARQHDFGAPSEEVIKNIGQSVWDLKMGNLRRAYYALLNKLANITPRITEKFPGILRNVLRVSTPASTATYTRELAANGAEVTATLVVAKVRTASDELELPGGFLEKKFNETKKNFIKEIDKEIHSALQKFDSDFAGGEYLTDIIRNLERRTTLTFLKGRANDFISGLTTISPWLLFSGGAYFFTAALNAGPADLLLGFIGFAVAHQIAFKEFNQRILDRVKSEIIQPIIAFFHSTRENLIEETIDKTAQRVLAAEMGNLAIPNNEELKELEIALQELESLLSREQNIRN